MASYLSWSPPVCLSWTQKQTMHNATEVCVVKRKNQNTRLGLRRHLPAPSCSSQRCAKEKEKNNPPAWRWAVFPNHSILLSRVPSLSIPLGGRKSAPSSDASNSQNQRKDICENSHASQEQSRRRRHKPLIPTAQQSPLHWLIQLPREFGHWRFQPVTQVNQGPLPVCASGLSPRHRF